MDSNEMISQRHALADPTMLCMDEGSVLLIAADEDESARVLGELSSVTEEPFRVEWVTEVSHGIERLRDGCVKAIVLDLNLPGSQVAETFDELFQAASKVPILILTEADTETVARHLVCHVCRKSISISSSGSDECVAVEAIRWPCQSPR